MNAREDAVWVADTITQLQAENERLRAALEEYSCPGIGQCPAPRLLNGECELLGVGMCGKVARDALEQNGDR